MTQNFATQRVGINETNPQAVLDVAGDIKVGNSSATCSTTTEGSIRYNATSYDLEFCDGSNWIIAGDGSAPVFACGDTVDYEGQTYATVEIGTQCWFAENLNVGTEISGVTEPTSGDAIIQKWCYGDLTSNCDTYGGFYNWNEMMDYTTAEGAQGICPSGWHIPTDAEQHTLDDYLATGACNPDRFVWDCDPAGTLMSDYTLNGINASGFSALLAGYRGTDGSFYYQGTYTNFWSSSENTSVYGRLRILSSTNSMVFRYSYGKTDGFSVRCLQD